MQGDPQPGPELTQVSPLAELFGVDPAATKEEPEPGQVQVAEPSPALAVLTNRLSASFRLPGAYDPAPRPHRLVGMCAWAALLGMVGLALAVRALFAIMTGIAPRWFEPAVVATGLVGITLTVGGFMAIHQRRLPWALLGAASATLMVNLVITLFGL